MHAEAQNTADLAKAALQYGPFLFAIIFILIVPPYAHAIWRRSFAASIAGQDQNGLLAEGRLYFRSSWQFGVCLVVCSILWWMYTQSVDSSTHAYSGYISVPHQEDQLGSMSPDGNEYLVPTTIDGNVQYRFVYISPTKLNGTVDIYISYTNTKAVAAATGQGVPSLPITIKLTPGQTHYQLVGDTTHPAMVVPVDAIHAASLQGQPGSFQ